MQSMIINVPMADTDPLYVDEIYCQILNIKLRHFNGNASIYDAVIDAFLVL